MNKKVLFTSQAAMIAALYVVLTIFISSFGLASGDVQVRISEALTILPYFTPAAIPGLTIGCFLSNLFTGCVPLDIIFGTLATLLGALGSYALRRCRWLVPLPPVIANTIIVPYVLRFAYGMDAAIPYLMISVGTGEIISCYILGLLLLFALERFGNPLFQNENN